MIQLPSADLAATGVVLYRRRNDDRVPQEEPVAGWPSGYRIAIAEPVPQAHPVRIRWAAVR